MKPEPYTPPPFEVRSIVQIYVTRDGVTHYGEPINRDQRRARDQAQRREDRRMRR